MPKISTIGAANIDVMATLQGPFVATSNNDARVNFNYGGSARNVAHNLTLLGEDVQLITIFGGDVFGGFMMDNCKKHGIDIHLSERIHDLSTSTYVAMLNPRGDRITAAVDDEVLQRLTPEFLAQRMIDINASDAVVMSSNLPVATMTYLMERCEAHLFASAVTTHRVKNLIEALQKAKNPHLFSVKVNRKGALAATGLSSVEQVADLFLGLGVEYVYITMAEEGVYCASHTMTQSFPPYEVDLVSTTGAGDAFLAGVVLAVKNSIPFPTTAQFGLRVAAATIGAEGVVNPDLLQVLQKPVNE